MSDRSVSPGTGDVNFNPNFNFASPLPIEPINAYNNVHLPDTAFVFSDSMRDIIAGDRRAPFTVTSVLPKCDYKEEWEPKERRTDAYIAAQIQILEYLSTHAADELTVAQAHFFTENVGIKPYGPTAKQVVELCYFMRSFGFDVYVIMVPRNNKIQAFIADRDALGRNCDHLYWKQDLKSGEIASLSSITSRSSRDGRDGRRDAVADIWDLAHDA